VSGVAKAVAVREALERKKQLNRAPAQGIVPTDGALIWLIDRDAGRLIRRGE
jgi:hypothetical protein